MPSRAPIRWTRPVGRAVWVGFAILGVGILGVSETRRVDAAVEYGARSTTVLSADAESFLADRIKWQQDVAADALGGDVDDASFAAALGGARTPFALLLDGSGAVIATFPTRSDIGPGTDLSGRFSHIDAAIEGQVGYWTLDAGARTETGTIVAIATPFTADDGSRILSTAFELGQVDLPSTLRTAATRTAPSALAGIVDSDGVLLSGESIGDVSASATRVLGADAGLDDVRAVVATAGSHEYEAAGRTRHAFSAPLGGGNLHLVASFDERDLLGAVGGPPIVSRIGVPLVLLLIGLVVRGRTASAHHLSSESVFVSGVGAMITTGADQRIRHVNAAAVDLLGMTEGALVGRSIDDLRLADGGDADAASGPVGSGDRQIVLVRGDGNPFVAVLRSRVLPTPVDEESVMVHLVTDESDADASRALISEQANEWRSLIEHSPLPLALIDRNGRVERVNESLVALLDRPSDDLMGELAVDVLSQGMSDGPLARLIAGARPNEARTVEHQVTRTDGTVAEVRSAAIGLADATGRITRTVLQLVDVTDANRLEREAARSREALEQFAARAAHDLKSPLSTIAGFANLIEEGGVDADLLADIVGRIRRSAMRASDQVQALLEHAIRIAETERVEVELHRVRSWLEDLLATELMASSGSIDLDADITAVVVEDVPFRQVLHNLCANSIKYARPTVPPRIVIRAERAGDAATIVVEDNGRGVGDEELVAIFSEGYQGEEDSPGVGLGLSTVRTLVAEFGGTIHAEHNRPHGLRIVITIPAQDRLPTLIPEEPVGATGPGPSG